MPNMNPQGSEMVVVNEKSNQNSFQQASASQGLQIDWLLIGLVMKMAPNRPQPAQGLEMVVF